MTCRQIKLRRVAGDRKWVHAPPPPQRGGGREEGYEGRGKRYKKYLTHLTHYPHRPPFTHTENLPPAIHATYYWGWGGSGTGINKKLPPFSPISCARSCLYLSYLSSIDSITPQPLPEPTFSKPVRWRFGCSGGLFSIRIPPPQGRFRLRISSQGGSHCPAWNPYIRPVDLSCRIRSDPSRYACKIYNKIKKYPPANESTFIS